MVPDVSGTIHLLNLN